MPRGRARTHNDGDVILLVGTPKGAFILSSDASRKKWKVDGPHFTGDSVYSMAYDERGGRRRLLAATKSYFFGSTIRTSDDFGRTWSKPDVPNIKFSEASGLSLVQVWQILPGPADDPDLLWAGTEPHCVFESRNGGDTWTEVEGLVKHEHRPEWTPGNGGLCLHTIVPDPVNRHRMAVAMSTGGVYRTEDGGKSWRARNVGVRAEFQPDKYPEFGQCVHKVVHHPSKPERLFMQNHGGLFRSDDWGDNWQEIAREEKKEYSDFGFAMQMHPRDPNTVYIVPLDGGLRCGPKGRLRVYRTRDAGASWESLEKGLPQRQAYETVLRDALTADSHDPAGLYVGTRSGKVFASADEGATWKHLPVSLPPVVCVKVAVVGRGPSA
jgi:photosystem II stability/assembly factor-like uncharacterized protein